MASTYTVPSVEPIPEDSEDESQVSRREGEDSASEQRQKRTSQVSKGSSRDKEKKRRSSKKKAKSTQSRKTSEVSKRDSGSDVSRRPRTAPIRRATSSSSSSEDDGPVPDHRAVLAAARARLTSPSMLSTITSQTTATNKSSSSSGSNSTITQASMSRGSSSVGKRPENVEAPPSPACPDPPNVFAFLEKDQTPDSSDSEEGEASQWPSTPTAPFVVAPILSPENASSSSSSFNGSDNFSNPPAEDDDTDRSTSPERSIHGQDETSMPLSPAEVKFAAHLAAAHQRQNLHGQFGTPNMPRGNTNLPHIPSSAISARRQYQSKQQVLPRAEKLPVTGYELLATRLASSNETGPKIKPIYRKFEALNHRLLLHLQDELSELEEQLHRLDSADTQSRRTDRQIIPASRRAAALAGGELQWHKTDILGKIGYKLNQYNQALSSFHSTQSLSAPAPGDIDNYRSYLQTEHPIAEAETHFLDPADDLVSIYSENLPPSVSSLDSYGEGSSILSSASLASSRSDPPSPRRNKSPSFTRESYPPSPLHSLSNATSSSLTPLTTAVGIAILLPILTYSTIPNFMGRMVVTALVAAGMIGALIQSGHLGSGVVLEREGWVVVGGYGAVMAVLAAFVC